MKKDYISEFITLALPRDDKKIRSHVYFLQIVDFSLPGTISLRTTCTLSCRNCGAHDSIVLLSIMCSSSWKHRGVGMRSYTDIIFVLIFSQWRTHKARGYKKRQFCFKEGLIRDGSGVGTTYTKVKTIRALFDIVQSHGFHPLAHMAVVFT